MVSRAHAQGYSHGTSEVFLVSPDSVVVAADSKEVYVGYDHRKRSEAEICKATRIGPYYAFVAGVVSGANGFNSLSEVRRLYRPGDGLDDVAESLSETLPIGLQSVVEDFRSNGRGGRASAAELDLTITLVGVEQERPRVIMSRFVVDAAGAVEQRIRKCPGDDCVNGNAAWVAGQHAAIDKYFGAAPGGRALSNPDPEAARSLLDLEYADRPDVVGGPPLLLRLAPGREEVIRHGACSGEWGGQP